MWSENRSVVSDSLWPHGLHSPWNSLGQNTGVGNCSLLQGIFPTEGLNSGLLNCRWILYCLSHLMMLSNLCLYCHMEFFPVFLSTLCTDFSLLLRTRVIGLFSLIQCDLNLATSVKTLLPKKVIFTSTGSWDFKSIILADTIKPVTGIYFDMLSLIFFNKK